MIHAALVASLIASAGVSSPVRPDTGIAPLAVSRADTAAAGPAAATTGLDLELTYAPSDSTPGAPEQPVPEPELSVSVGDIGPRAAPSGFARPMDGGWEVAGGLTVPGMGTVSVGAASDTGRPRSKRPRAIEYSDWYYRRLMMHRIASFAELPLFATEFVLGERVLHDEQHGFPPSSLRTAHSAVADGLLILFGFNTITGGWNLWASRHDPAGRPRRLVHTLLMLVSDAGFLATAQAGGPAKHHLNAANTHRALAEGSMGVALAGTAMMWLWRN
jgi:hypothetical protein